MDTATKTILLVEDDRFLRRACEVSLRQRGLTVSTAADGEEALRSIRAAPPALILLDLLLPKLSGLDVLRALRSQEETCTVPVLVLSNSSNERDVEEVRALGVAGYLVKANLSLKELSDHVTRLLQAA
jgi:DNA-binding response OmpR family regulator